jgi:hypothetical protein
MYYDYSSSYEYIGRISPPERHLNSLRFKAILIGYNPYVTNEKSKC